MRKSITIFCIIGPIILIYCVGLSIGVFICTSFLAVTGIILIYTYLDFSAKKQLCVYEMEANIISILRKASFGCRAEQGWLSGSEIVEAVSKIFKDQFNYHQFSESFRQLQKKQVILEKIINIEQEQGERLYRLNENSNYRPKKPNKPLKKSEVSTNHVHA